METIGRKYTSELADKYKTYWMIRKDMNWAISAINIVEPELKKDGDHDSVLVKAVWSSVIIAYRRCFNTGVRNKVDNEFFITLPDGAKIFHEWMLGMADKHIAHSENPFEDGSVCVYLPENPGSVSVNIGTTTVEYLYPDYEAFGNACRICEFLRDYSIKKIEEIETPLGIEISSLPLDVLNSLPEYKYTAPAGEMANKARKNE
jgi:hypothetical protein